MPAIATVEDYICSIDDALRDIAVHLRSVLDNSLVGARGELWQGHPVWLNGKDPVAGFKADSSCVTFMIWDAESVEDTSGRLETGSRLATVQLTSPAEVDRRLFTDWLHQAL